MSHSSKTIEAVYLSEGLVVTNLLFRYIFKSQKHLFYMELDVFADVVHVDHNHGIDTLYAFKRAGYLRGGEAVYSNENNDVVVKRYDSDDYYFFEARVGAVEEEYILPKRVSREVADAMVLYLFTDLVCLEEKQFCNEQYNECLSSDTPDKCKAQLERCVKEIARECDAFESAKADLYKSGVRFLGCESGYDTGRPSVEETCMFVLPPSVD